MTVLQGEMHEQLAVGRGPEGQGIAQGRGSPSPNTDGRGTAGSAPHSQLSTVSRFTGRSKTPQRTLTWPKWVCRSHGPLPSRLLLRNAWTTGPQKCTWLTDKKDQDLPGPSICTTSQQWLGPRGEMSPAFQGQNSGFPSGARLDDPVILVTLKFAEKHSVQLRWSSQNIEPPEGRGREEGAEP